jgi:hypothetical protein
VKFKQAESHGNMPCDNETLNHHNTRLISKFETSCGKKENLTLHIFLPGHTIAFWTSRKDFLQQSISTVKVSKNAMLSNAWVCGRFFTVIAGAWKFASPYCCVL